MKGTLLLCDTPNLGRSVQNGYGPEVRPDYQALLSFAASVGKLTAAFALVNDGVKDCFVQSLTRLGYQVNFSHARDVDELLIAKAVAFHHRTSRLILASGDGGYCSLVDLLHSRGISTILVGVPSSCSRYLRELAGGFFEMPIARRFQYGANGNRDRCSDAREPVICGGEL